MDEKSIMSQIIDTPVEEVDKLIREGNFDLTALTNFKKGLELQYQRVEGTKNEIVNGLKEGKYTNREEAENTVKQLYIALQLIEDRATLVQQHINERKITH